MFGELLLDGTKTLRGMILDVLNDIIALQAYPPAAWKSARLSVIFKKGDPTLPDNYRPISILPILYKVFSRMVGDRLCSILMPLQAVDQAAYRKTFSTDDHTFVVTQVVEKSLEYNLPIWLVLIDYTKAFDTVELTMLWKVLADQGVHPDFILLLQRLYTGAQAYVRTDVSSQSFPICRGVRQCDPIFPLFVYCSNGAHLHAIER